MPSHAKPGLPLGALLRAARAGADFSQRELAAAAGLPLTTLARLESGEHRDPRLSTILTLLRAAECDLLAVTATGRPLQPWLFEQAVDQGGRHLPAHRDVRVVRTAKDWSGSARYQTWVNPRLPLFTYDARLVRRGRRE